jgi:site-specific recombinase XerD
LSSRSAPIFASSGQQKDAPSEWNMPSRVLPHARSRRSLGSSLRRTLSESSVLLARLGLRASEVAQLKFTDIDWRNGSITVCGKGRRQESLPLPQEVGDAILLYLRKGRAPLAIPVIFTSVRAPFQAMSRATVTGVVRSALHRAGIKAPINGAHVLRHSASSSMLRCGASLGGVGAVLRHRSLSTTTHYAKVDFGLLSTIAQPWPEVPSC